MATIEEFGLSIKKKYPQYQNIDNALLAQKMLEKYPQYRDRVFDTDPNIQQQVAGDRPTQGVWDAVKVGAKNIWEGIKQSGNELADTMATPTTSYGGEFAKTAKAGTGIATGVARSLIAEPVATVLRAGGELVQSGTGYDINEAASKGMQKLVQAGMDTEAAKKTVEAYDQFKKENPEAGLAASSVGDIAELLSYLIGYKGAKGAVNKVESGLEGTVSKVKSALPEIPAGTGEKAIQTAGNVAEGTFSKTYGLEPSTIRQVIKNPELFTEKEMAKITDESIFNKVKTAVDSRIDDLAETGKEYGGIRQSGQQIKLPDNFIENSIKQHGFDVVDGKIVATTKSLTRNSSDIGSLQKLVDMWSGKSTIGADEFLNLRSDLAELAKYDKITGMGKTKASETIGKQLRSDLNKAGRPQVKGLEALDKTVSSEIELMRKVKKAIFNSDGSIKNNAVSTISNLTGKGKEQILSQVEKIVPGITKDVNILKAIKDIRWAQGNKVGTYGRAMLGTGGGFLAGGPLGAIMGMIATSPQMGVALLRAFAKLKNIDGSVLNKIITKLEKGQKLVGDEIKVMNGAVDNAAKKLGKRVKDIRPGLSIKQDLSFPNKKSPLIEEAGKKIPKIHPQDLDILSDYTDMVYGKKDLGETLKKKIREDADRIIFKYGIKEFSTEKGQANAFGKILEKFKFKR